MHSMHAIYSYLEKGLCRICNKEIDRPLTARQATEITLGTARGSKKPGTAVTRGATRAPDQPLTKDKLLRTAILRLE